LPNKHVSINLRRMTRDDAIAALKALEPEARALGVTGLYLFGSTARGEAGPTSDVDVFFDYDTSRVRGLQFFAIKHFLEDHGPPRLDVGTRNGLRAELRDQIETTSIRIF
jgi:uncharacterized protein